MLNILNFNNQKPETIVDDFSIFINYLNENKIKLTKTNQFLQGKVVYTLNQTMTLEVMENVTTRTPQDYYPLIHLFYHLAISAKLFEINYKKSYNSIEPTKDLKKYQKLTKTEKYLFLLETLWLDCDWQKLQVGRLEYRCEEEVEEVLAELLKNGIDKYVKTTNDSLKGPASLLEYFLKYLSYFSLWRIKYDGSAQERLSSKRAYSADGITLSRFGA